MANTSNGQIRDRLAELERADRRRLMESTLKLLSGTDASNDVELTAVPVDLLIGRFHDIERSITDVRRDFSGQLEMLRAKTRWTYWALAVLFVAVGTIAFLSGRRSSSTTDSSNPGVIMRRTDGS